MRALDWGIHSRRGVSPMKQIIAAITISVLFAVPLPVTEASEIGASVTFSDGDVRIISAWYTDHGSKKNGKHGKGGQNGLPPGIAKNLTRGKSLPPGIAKQYLPEGLRQELPAPPSGYERIMVDGRILLVEIATQVIHDVLTDVILN